MIAPGVFVAGAVSAPVRASKPGEHQHGSRVHGDDEE
jgi:hypothetical protein